MVIDDVMARSENKAYLVDLCDMPNKQALKLAEKSPSSFCVNFRTLLTSSENVVVEITHSTVPLETVIRRIRGHFKTELDKMVF